MIDVDKLSIECGPYDLYMLIRALSGIEIPPLPELILHLRTVVDSPVEAVELASSLNLININDQLIPSLTGSSAKWLCKPDNCPITLQTIFLRLDWEWFTRALDTGEKLHFQELLVLCPDYLKAQNKRLIVFIEWSVFFGIARTQEFNSILPLRGVETIIRNS